MYPGKVLGWGGPAFFVPHPDEIEPRPVFEKKPPVWEEDMELYSKFLDRKVRGGSTSLGFPFPHGP